MAHSATGSEGEDGGEDGGVSLDEGEGSSEFGGGGGGGVEGRGCGEEGGEEEVGGCEEGGEYVLRDHHLGAGVGAMGGEDVVLGAVCEAVEEEVDR